MSLHAQATTYVFERGDTLSKIAYTSLPGRVYGRNGNLLRLLRLNPQLRNPHHIAVGTRIELGELPTSEAPETVVQERVIDKIRVPASVDPVLSVSPPSSRVDENLPVLISRPHVSIGYRNTQITAVDSHAESDSSSAAATLVSKNNSGVTLGWDHLWSESFQSFVEFGLTKISFEPTANVNGKNIDSKSSTLSEMRVGAKSDFFSKRLRLVGALEEKKNIFIRSENSQKITFDSIAISSFKLGFEYLILHGQNYDLGGQVLASYSMPTTGNLGYEIKKGNGTNLNLTLTQALSRHTFLGVSTFFDQQSVSTSILQQREIDLGMNLSFSWIFGPSETEK
ncbi:MAG: LysM peptidoglycan-binding domain-containing protein [Bdellovibrionota bacterium]